MLKIFNGFITSIFYNHWFDKLNFVLYKEKGQFYKRLSEKT